MKALYYLPFLFLAACGEKDDPKPTTGPHTVEVQYLATYTGNAPTASMYRPLLTADFGSTSQIDYPASRVEYQTSQTPGKATVGTYTGAERIYLTLTMFRDAVYNPQQYPSDYRIVATILVDGKPQPGSLTVTKSMMTTTGSSLSYDWESQLDSKDVVL